MVFQLDEAAIERALPLVSVGLEKYCWLQAALATTNVAQDRTFQRKFNGFYRVRRNVEWQRAFYDLLQEEKAAPKPFACVLRALHATTGKVEASFASKLTASVDPSKPVIDSFVLSNLGLRLAPAGSIEVRLVETVRLHDHIGRHFADYLETDMGRYLVTRFQNCYPDRHLTQVKMLDLILWQSR